MVPRPTRTRFGPGDRVTTSVLPPKLSSFPVEREQIEYSSRSMVFRSSGDGVLRVWGTAEEPWVLGVVPRRSRWEVRAWGASATKAREAARNLFSFDHPLEEFYKLARHEPTLRRSIRRFRGLRLPRDANLYESLVHAVIGQQLSVRAANTIRSRLFSVTQAQVEVEGVEVPHIPTPAAIAELGPLGLRQVGLSRAKSAALVELARREMAGALDRFPWNSLNVEEAVARLDELPGVGRWTAENALLRGVGRTDVFVAGDLAIIVALDEYGLVRRSAREAQRRAWSDRHFPGWGSYVTLYLWRQWVADRQAAAGG